MLKLFSKLKEEKENSPETLWIKSHGYDIYSRYIGEIRHGPAYLSLNANPEIKYLENKYFGDRKQLFIGGLIIEEWHSLDHPNFSLLYIDFKEKKLFFLAGIRLKYSSWQVQSIEDEKFHIEITDIITKGKTEIIVQKTLLSAF